nr:WYL domain-containing protein [Eubacterium sp.]
MIFHEIYGCYYQAVAKILEQAVEGTLTRESMQQTIDTYGFSESALTIIPAFEEERWQLVDMESMESPVMNKPALPISNLEREWLKAVSQDPRAHLFGEIPEMSEEITPLYTPEDVVVYDQYRDGDSYNDPSYIENFQKLLSAIHNKKKVKLLYESGKGRELIVYGVPTRLEYSEKDDKFRVLLQGARHIHIINVARVAEVEVMERPMRFLKRLQEPARDFFVMELYDGRNALERVMLHFAHFQKEAERLDNDHYRIKIFYNKDDETELLIRVLSFGPFVRVTEPESFVELIKERLKQQRVWGV